MRMVTAKLVPTNVFDGTEDEALCLRGASSSAYRIGTLALPDSECTFSVWMRGDAPMTVSLTVLGVRVAAAQVDAVWRRFSWRVTRAGGRAIDIAPEGDGAVYLYKAMLEAGDRASDWQPAPEDAEERLETLQAALGSEIDLTREQIALRVRAEDLEMSLRVQEDGVHVGRLGDYYEARISGEAFDIMAGPRPVASFRNGLIVIGGWAFRVTADGGLSQSRQEAEA